VLPSKDLFFLNVSPRTSQKYPFLQHIVVPPSKDRFSSTYRRPLSKISVFSTYRRLPLKKIRFFQRIVAPSQKYPFFIRIVAPLSPSKSCFPFRVLTAPLDGVTTISKDYFLPRVDEILFQISHPQILK
jgi:hypothetical protein